jgi:hypothetical protein
MQAWNGTVFEAFGKEVSEDEVEGIIVMTKGLPFTYIPDAEDLVKELKDFVEDEECGDLSDITETDVYKFLNPAKAAKAPTAA